MTADTIVSVEEVSKSYTRGNERLTVLDRISLTIQRNEFVALMGPSGSGKTTLLNLIAGLDQPDSGALIVAGENIAKLPERALAAWRVRNVGFIFQFYNLIPVLSALENVSLPLTLLSMSRKERTERAMFALEIVGLGDRKDHLPSQLSGGQEQRVAIARALITDPTLIVADEPTGDLDRASATEVLNLLGTLNRDHGKSIIMVTHDATAAEYAQRKVLFDKGKLIS